MPSTTPWRTSQAADKGPAWGHLTWMLTTRRAQTSPMFLSFWPASLDMALRMARSPGRQMSTSTSRLFAESFLPASSGSELAFAAFVCVVGR